MRRALLRLGQILSLAALLATCGGHWLVIQSFAWARMLVENAETTQFTVAVEKTFDGQHPCAICKSIASAKGKESKQQRTAVVTKVPLFCEGSGGETVVLLESRMVRGVQPAFAARFGDPAVPPPRSFLV